MARSEFESFLGHQLKDAVNKFVLPRSLHKWIGKRRLAGAVLAVYHDGNCIPRHCYTRTLPRLLRSHNELREPSKAVTDISDIQLFLHLCQIELIRSSTDRLKNCS